MAQQDEGPNFTTNPPKGYHPKPRSSMPPSGKARPLEGLSRELSQEGEALGQELGQVVGGLSQELQQVGDALGGEAPGGKGDQSGQQGQQGPTPPAPPHQ